MCIGKNMAMMNILKVATTILKFYELDLVEPDQEIRAVSVGISEKEGPLRVRVKRRTTTKDAVEGDQLHLKVTYDSG